MYAGLCRSNIDALYKHPIENVQGHLLATFLIKPYT